MPVWIWKDPNDKFMTFKEFVQIYVCQKRRYSDEEAQRWLREYNLSMDSRVVFVQTGHFKDAVRITDGYLLDSSGKCCYDIDVYPSDRGKMIYLFVSNKRI